MIDYAIKILGIKEEDGSWTAIALCMNLMGQGITFDDALDTLIDAIDTQINFAKKNDLLDELFFPAEKCYWDLYNRLVIEGMKQEESTRNSGADIPHVVKDVFMYDLLNKKYSHYKEI